jgi:hypothetical protein
MRTDPRLPGPDFLDAVADAEEGNGNRINAAEYRRRAKEWRHDLAELERANAARGDLEHRMATIQRQSAPATTPTSH